MAGSSEVTPCIDWSRVKDGEDIDPVAELWEELRELGRLIGRDARIASILNAERFNRCLGPLVEPVLEGMG